MTSELAPQQQSLLPVILTQAAQKDEDAVFDVKDNLTGIKPQIPTLEIIHRGQLFRIKDSSEASFPNFKGVIVYHHNGRSYFSQPMGGGTKQRPDCTSVDGYFGKPTNTNPDGTDSCPIPMNQRQHNQRKYSNPFVCSTCPMNAWGTDIKGGRGKGCSEKHRIFVFPVDAALASMIPYRIVVPPSSLKAVNAYFSLLVSKNVPHQIVVTEFKLNKQLAPSGEEYAELVMLADFSKRLPRNDQLVLKGFIDRYKGAFQEIDEPEPESQPAPEDPDAPAPRGEGLPF